MAGMPTPTSAAPARRARPGDLFARSDWTLPRLAPRGARVAMARWERDGLNLWVVEQDGRRAPATMLAARRIKDYAWRVDGGGFLLTLDEQGDERRWVADYDSTRHRLTRISPPDAADATLLRQFGGARPRALLCCRAPSGGLSLVEVDLASGERRALPAPLDGASRYLAGPTGDLLAVRGGQGGASWWRRGPDELTWRHLLDPSPGESLTTTPLALSASGEGLFALSARGRDTVALTRLDLAGGMRVVADCGEFDVSRVWFDAADGQPHSLVGADPLGVPRGLTPAAVVELDRLAAALPCRVERIRLASQNATCWALEIDGAGRAPTFHRYDRASGRLTELASRHEALAGAVLSERRAYWLRAEDGLPLQAFRTEPAGPPPWPTVLLAHGGPWVRDEPGFHPQAQWLAALGYLCLQVNYRGSTGFGQRFLAAGDRQWGRAMRDDLVAVIEHAVAAGWADPGRVAAMGHSYGGYAALTLAASVRAGLRCVVASAAPANLRDFVADAVSAGHPGADEYRRRIGDPDLDAAMLLAVSPERLASQISAPVLLAHGARDSRVPWRQTHALTTAFDRHGVAYELLRFEREGHYFARPATREALHAHAARFLARHLGGSSEPGGG